MMDPFSFLQSYLLFSSIISIHSAQQTCGGNADGADCTFPFTYSSLTWNQCTTFGKTRPWCSTTSDYDTDGTWGYCTCDDDVTPSPIFSNAADEPDHYSYSRGNINDGVLTAYVIRLIFEGEEDISDFEWTNASAPSISLFYTDSSWGKLNFSYNILPDNYRSSLDESTITTSQIAMEAFRLAEEDGYIWCNGICGSDGRLSRDPNHFDQFVVAVRDKSDVGNTAFGYWAGLGVIGLPKTWVLSNAFTPAVVCWW